MPVPLTAPPLAVSVDLQGERTRVAKTPQEQRRAGVWALIFPCSPHMTLQVGQE